MKMSVEAQDLSQSVFELVPTGGEIRESFFIV
jgi:hypothetical protein